MQGLDNPFEAARYHSLVIEKDSCPDDLEVTAWTEDGIIMGVQHKQHAHIQVCCSNTCNERTRYIELVLDQSSPGQVHLRAAVQITCSYLQNCIAAMLLARAS